MVLGSSYGTWRRDADRRMLQATGHNAASTMTPMCSIYRSIGISTTTDRPTSILAPIGGLQSALAKALGKACAWLPCPDRQVSD